MIYFDPVYMILMVVMMGVAGLASYRLKKTYSEASEKYASSGVTGAQVAQMILDREGISNVRIEPVDGYLSDHYDPKNKVLRLSPSNYSGRSLAALGVAAHEVGHAIQDAKRYAPLVARNAIVPAAGFGSNMSMFLIAGGMMFSSMNLMLAGVVLFSFGVIFQVVNLPVEFDASARAKSILYEMGIITDSERPVVSKVLNAAAMTYVAATITAIVQLLYFFVLCWPSRR